MKNRLRTAHTAQKYRDFVASGGLDTQCALCFATPIHIFKYWKIICNDFPYDRIADIHDMIVPIRHSTENSLSKEEKEEFLTIKESHLQAYELLIEATYKIKSIPAHFHIHLVNVKEAT